MEIDQFVDGGYRGIVVLEKSHKESSSQRDDHYHISVVAKNKSGKCFKLSADEHWNVFKGVSRSSSVPLPISEDEYQQLVEKHGISDTDEWYEKRSKAEEERKRVEVERARLTPTCPLCKGTMSVKENGRTKQKFFGCDKFPRCGGSVSGSPGVFAALAKL
ncbi:MAG: hypothetical protein U0324_19415 [Polyangiales bacterium]